MRKVKRWNVIVSFDRRHTRRHHRDGTSMEVEDYRNPHMFPLEHFCQLVGAKINTLRVIVVPIGVEETWFPPPHPALHEVLHPLKMIREAQSVTISDATPDDLPDTIPNARRAVKSTSALVGQTGFLEKLITEMTIKGKEKKLPTLLE